MNFAILSKLFETFSEFSAGVIQSKSANSEAGAIITNTERIGIVARVAGVWADDDCCGKSISIDELKSAFQNGGWEVKTKEDNTL
jgi:hypothetical protein